MSIMGIIMHNVINKNPKNLFIYDSSGFLAFPQLLSLVDTSSS
jgi:hypothetical protein